jgi:tetratricopeptide (TPR) repeat protein
MPSSRRSAAFGERPVMNLLSRLLRSAWLRRRARTGAALAHARALLDAGQAEAAAAACRMLLEDRSCSADELYQLGLMLARLNDLPGARCAFGRAAALRPDWADAHNALGNVEKLAGCTTVALYCYERALALAPGSAAIYANIGICLRDAGRLEDAAALLDRALALVPDHAEALLNRAIVSLDLGRFDAAEAQLRELLLRVPDMAEAHTALAHVLLLKGDFEHGWPEYEWHYRLPGAPALSTYPYPAWDGSPLSQRTLLVRAEQGLGDQIMFASCLRDAMARAASCIVECDARLVPLLQRSFPAAHVCRRRPDNPHRWRETGQSPATQIFCSSLPCFFRRRRQDFPHHDGYLRADAAKTTAWRKTLSDLGPGLKIGVSWRGGAPQTRQQLRSIPLTAWRELLDTPGAHFISLQYGNDAADAIRASGLPLRHWPQAIADYEETAALVSALDLVISVQTAVVHLAGALGRPAWVLVPAVPEWRYLADGDALPWYPSVRLYRQQRMRQWIPLLDRVRHDLEAMLCDRHRRNK